MLFIAYDIDFDFKNTREMLIILKITTITIYSITAITKILAIFQKNASLFKNMIYYCDVNE